MFVKQVGALTGGSAVAMTGGEKNYQPRYLAQGSADSVSIARQTSRSRGFLRTVRNLAAGAAFAFGLHSCSDATKDLPTPIITKTLTPTAQTMNGAVPALFAADTTGTAKNLQLVDTLFASDQTGGYTAIKLQDAYTNNNNVRYKVYDLDADKVIQGVQNADFSIDSSTGKLVAKFTSDAQTGVITYTKSGASLINDAAQVCYTPDGVGTSIVKRVSTSNVLGKIKMLYQKTKQVSSCIK
jgi:hypothetical protein